MTTFGTGRGLAALAVLLLLATMAAELRGEENDTQVEKDPQKDMESLLHWAVTHSDPDELREQALAAGGGGSGQKMTIEQLKALAAQRAKIREAIDVFNEEPTETELIKEAVESITGYAKGDQDPEDSEEVNFITNTLKGLQILTEPIDNANDLKVLKALEPLVAMLKASLPIRMGAAAVIGTAASNNPTFQGHIMEIGDGIVMKTLLDLMTGETGGGEGGQEAAARYLYGISAMIRNSAEPRDAFFEAGGSKALGVTLQTHATSESSIKLVKRCLQITADLAMLQDTAGGHQLRLKLLEGGELMGGIAAVLTEGVSRLDVIEDALSAVEALAHDSDSTEKLKKDPKTAEALSKVVQRLLSFKPEDEDEKEYVDDLISQARGLQEAVVSSGRSRDEL